ncbi:DedA family protein [Marimonas arenosa]|uniref:DedA family protein n=1 Tax=Marimonas arenosa TaxID=1795305 RepID=A0AAE3WAR1_9RHOB|nr:DedA family protein [Marimonas arenosa]MDQ2089274.1 DedA family protein [Marimonas arenosa]
MTFEGLIQAFGLPGLALGSALEGDAVTFFGGVLAHRGMFPLTGVVLASAAGAIFIDNLLFLAGRHAGQSRLVRTLLRRGPVATAQGWLGRNAVLTLLAFRFVWGMKTVTVLLIANTAVSWRRFAVLDASGVLLWAGTFAGLGFGAGTAIEAMLGRLKLHHHLGTAGVVFLAVAGLWWLMRRVGRREGGER